MERAIETPVDGKNAIINFLIDSTKATLGALPPHVLERLREAALEPSPVVASVNAAELIYANADDLPAELLAIGAEVTSMAATFNFHGMAEGGRGAAIAREIRKRPGVAEAAAPEPSEPPEVKPEFKKPTPAPTPAPTPTSAPGL